MKCHTFPKLETKPKIGMKFESLDEAFSFYNQYARESGFSARISNSKKKSGGPEHVGCTERDIRNYEKTLRDEHKGIDAETLIDLFMSEKDKSSTFFFDYETDSDNRFIRCFWADPVSRRAYTAFGDVVVFDTTYNTNKYGMIFAPFIGVNHHHQTIVFGCGFLSDEKTDSFVWFLNKFL
ncbi:protein FAR1-RELATED SEQUENCE 5-like [Primulina eburnea]|uniref:protein FAR1-RELATED SEQUENCE 5-like n=1 Tax=Primulina eburnea TaxID=1245227 RepID=UPI003C6C7E9D